MVKRWCDSFLKGLLQDFPQLIETLMLLRGNDKPCFSSIMKNRGKYLANMESLFSFGMHTGAITNFEVYDLCNRILSSPIDLTL